MDKYAAMEWVKRGVGNLTEEEFDNAVNTYHTRYGKNPLELNIKAYTYSVPDLVNFVQQNRQAAAAPPTGGRRRRTRRSRKSRKSRKNKSSRR